MRSILKKIRGRLRKQTTNAAVLACVEQNTFTSPAGQWYLPALAGPGTFWNEITRPVTIRGALEIMQRLANDSYTKYVIDFYNAGLARFGDQWVYADINTVLFGISRILQPQSYLEIGVRRGRSMAMVVSQAPTCSVVGFDLWIKDYAGMENPGEEFVRLELNKIGHKGNAEFVSGDSKVTVPLYFQARSNPAFDLITVDGDHSEKGARLDLENVIPHLKVGGVLVFDDTCNQSHRGLTQLWTEVVVNNPSFASHTFNEVGFGVGFAVKKANDSLA